MGNNTLINYEELVDCSMRSIVKKALLCIDQNTLPGNHHFFITFLTSYPGVSLSDYLKNQYPKEMTIVVQYQFEDLLVEEDKFGISLIFNSVKEHISIPYESLIAFTDPSVKFSIQFKHKYQGEDSGKEQKTIEKPGKASVSTKKKPDTKKRKIITHKSGDNVIMLDQFLKKKD